MFNYSYAKVILDKPIIQPQVLKDIFENIHLTISIF